MITTNSSKYSKTKYNTLFNFKKLKFPTNFEKIIKDRTSISNEKSFINNSVLSTKLNSSDSFLFKSIYINNNIRLFRIKNLSKKKESYTSSCNRSHNFFKKFIRKKFINNFDKIKQKSEFPKLDIFHSYNSTPQIKTNKDNTKEIQKISYFDKLFRDELLDIRQYNDSEIMNKYKNSTNYFKESTKNRILIRNYLFQKEKIYQKELEINKNYKKEILEQSEKMKYFYNDILNNKINKLVDYNFFLKKRIKIEKEKNFELYKYTEKLINELKDLFMKIKIISDKLWILFDMRNFLICVKEEISVKKLPLAFRCYNSEYLDELSKLNEKDIFYIRQMKEKKDNLNIFHLPNNLVLYIKSINALAIKNVDKNFSKYLDINYKIFSSPDEFIKQYKLIEKKILDHLRSSIEQKNLNDNIKFNLISKMKEIKKGGYSNIKGFDIVENEYKKMKNNNENYIKKKLKLSLSIDDIKTKKLENKENNLIINSNIEEKKDEKFLKLIRRNKEIENNQFFYELHQLKKEKNFFNKKEYIYYFIVKMNLNFFKKCPEYYYNQEIFRFKKFNEYLDNIKNSQNFPDYIIRENIIYLLNIYENGINNFLFDYRNNVEKYKKSEEYYKIKKKENNDKKKYLFEKQRFLEKKIKEMKTNRYYRKFTKYRYIQRNQFINLSSFNLKSKGKSLEIKANNKNDYDEENNNLLKY